VTRHRHERWLHTRISEDLEEALKREARRRRSPVSLVVRNVLEGALDLVEDIVEDSLQIARRSRGLARAASQAGPGAQETGSAERAPLDDVYGWQDLILNRPADCAQCGSALRTGASAYRGLRDEPGPPIFLCSTCVQRLRRQAAPKEEGPR
jgi:hypothetical protein